ncbi:MAG: hypothetical protein OEY59_04025 [Deltaproteobacteria bacterium]|nr:hypothetical protein [Deltaproteobacteria bacterium]
MLNFEAILLIIKSLIAGIVVVCSFLYVIKPLLKSLSDHSGLLQPPKGSHLYESIERELEIIPEESSKNPIDRLKIIQEAKKNYPKTTYLVRDWINEKIRT